MSGSRPQRQSTTRLSSRPTARRVLREEIRDYLVEDILNGRLAPGERIIETRVAQHFGVSHAPVREALRDLELLGFVVSSPFRGALVRENSIDDLVQLYPIRAVLEGLAAREAASRISKSELRQLRKLLTTMRRAAARGDTHTQVQADFRFHLTIVEACGNRLLKQIWEGMRLATTTFLTASKSHRSMDVLADRHELVLHALETRDPGGAERAMRQHIEEPGAWIQAILEEEAAGKRPGGTTSKRARTRRRRHVAKIV
jgi:DNA-binding GntR family transcriptional regulator